jgi:hypothetical protein
MVLTVVGVHPPIEVARSGFVHDGRYAREVGGNVMLETVVTDAAQQFLQPWDFHDARAAERFGWMVSEATTARVAADFSMHIVRGKLRKAHGASLARPTHVLLAACDAAKVDKHLRYLFSYVAPGQSSVRNGDAGRPSLLYKLHSGLSAHA